jgi:predicted ATPase
MQGDEPMRPDQIRHLTELGLSADQFGNGGHRTALPRHQTLRATVDWSYELLPEPERMVLRRLAIFAGGFGLDAARMVAASTEITPSAVVNCVANLVIKSLVTADVGDATEHYRLLETTRAYALEKLTESGELASVGQRYAEYYRNLFERAEWLPAYKPRIDNLRAALDWAFSPSVVQWRVSGRARQSPSGSTALRRRPAQLTRSSRTD